MFSYEKKNAMNKAIDKVIYSNNNKMLLTVDGLCGINHFYRVQWKKTGLKSDPQYTILVLKLVNQGVEIGKEKKRHLSRIPRKEYLH